MRLVDLMVTAQTIIPYDVLVLPTPYRFSYVLAHALEGLQRVFKLKYPGYLDKLAPGTLDYLDMDFVFSSRKAARMLGYRPLYSVEQCIEKAVREVQMGHMLPALS